MRGEMSGRDQAAQASWEAQQAKAKLEADDKAIKAAFDKSDKRIKGIVEPFKLEDEIDENILPGPEQFDEKNYKKAA